MDLSRLLRLRTDRPCGCCATEKRDELPPSHRSPRLEAWEMRARYHLSMLSACSGQGMLRRNGRTWLRTVRVMTAPFEARRGLPLYPKVLL
jgi:hypothetical protein